MSDFAWSLFRMVATGDSVVLDNTELNGTYDFELTLDAAPEQMHRDSDQHRGSPDLWCRAGATRFETGVDEGLSGISHRRSR